MGRERDKSIPPVCRHNPEKPPKYAIGIFLNNWLSGQRGSQDIWNSISLTEIGAFEKSRITSVAADRRRRLRTGTPIMGMRRTAICYEVVGETTTLCVKICSVGLYCRSIRSRIAHWIVGRA
jgi:hypothetical protein